MPSPMSHASALAPVGRGVAEVAPDRRRPRLGRHRREDRGELQRQAIEDRRVSHGRPSAALHDLDEAAEAGRGVRRFRVHEEHRGAARAGTRRRVDHALPLRLQRLEGRLRVADAIGDVDQAAAAAALLDLPRHRRRVGERLEQLHRAERIVIAGPQQHLAHLIGAMHLFAMDLAEAEAAPGRDVCLELAGRHRDGDVIEAEPAGHAGGIERRGVEARRQHEASLAAHGDDSTVRITPPSASVAGAQ